MAVVVVMKLQTRYIDRKQINAINTRDNWFNYLLTSISSEIGTVDEI